MKIVQPDIIKNLERAFGNIVMDMRTPMGPGITVSRPKENEETIGPTDQQRYRSGVGMLLYLVKLSRPDVSNAVRELSKVMDGATSDHVEMLHRGIKFVLITRERGVLNNPNLERGVHAFVDSGYAGDSDNRRSITGYIIYFCGVAIAWKSKQQHCVTLSSSEAEYYAISEVSMELKSLKMILDFLEIDLGGLMRVYVDNIGAFIWPTMQQVEREQSILTQDNILSGS